MKPLSQRRAFTCLMSVSAAGFVIGISRQTLAGQADLIADIFKIGGAIFICTGIISFCVWTLIHLKRAPFENRPLSRGALAGFISAAIIIPLPFFGWALKTQTLTAYQDGGESLFAAMLSAIPSAISLGLSTFIDITKASLIALIASSILGALISHYVQAKPANPKIK